EWVVVVMGDSDEGGGGCVGIEVVVLWWKMVD
ncbi:hypothetical protein A2U01_0107479, partial [Trifolium medium]|nr:hypothetical protein [Trifolium medium]